MKMYIIVDKYNEGFYYNFEKEDFYMDITEQSLLPSKEMAKTYIEDQLCSDCVPAEIDIESVSKMGTWVYSIENVWDDDKE
jgi:hypothetical protein